MQTGMYANAAVLQPPWFWKEQILSTGALRSVLRNATWRTNAVSRPHPCVFSVWETTWEVEMGWGGLTPAFKISVEEKVCGLHSNVPSPFPFSFLSFFPRASTDLRGSAPWIVIPISATFLSSGTHGFLFVHKCIGEITSSQLEIVERRRVDLSSVHAASWFFVIRRSGMDD